MNKVSMYFFARYEKYFDYFINHKMSNTKSMMRIIKNSDERYKKYLKEKDVVYKGYRHWLKDGELKSNVIEIFDDFKNDYEYVKQTYGVILKCEGFRDFIDSIDD